MIQQVALGSGFTREKNFLAARDKGERAYHKATGAEHIPLFIPHQVVEHLGQHDDNKDKQVVGGPDERIHCVDEQMLVAHPHKGQGEKSIE